MPESERDRKFQTEAMEIIELGAKQGIPFRLIGSLAVRLHSPKYRYLYEGIDRPVTDIDYVTYGKFNAQVTKFFRGLGYEPNRFVMAVYGSKRNIFWSEEKGWQADIFFNALDMCHKVDFRNRLELDYPTITLVDILLEKMQIVEINAKDLKDVIIMMREHGIGETDKEEINLPYIVNLLANDWGYYYTVITNLQKTRAYLERFNEDLPKEMADQGLGLTAEDKADVAAKLDKVIAAIEAAPKSTKWKLRSKIGTKMLWYNKVEEVRR
jgi:hypothetical protein